MAEFVYQMIKARKAYGDRVILDDVTLSFLPGAKIGVVGPNGSHSCHPPGRFRVATAVPVHAKAPCGLSHTPSSWRNSANARMRRVPTPPE